MKPIHQRPTFLLLLLTFSNASKATNLTSLVNLFIGTASGANGGSGGNAFPGAAVPHAMAKVGIDVSTAPRQAGYIHDNSSITGISLLHDEGTGGNTDGGYGNFPLFPFIGSCTNSSGVNNPECEPGIAARAALRAAGTDIASPGYFSTTFVSGIQIETTSTRRAGLIRFTFPVSNATNYLVVDLTNDLGRSFSGGTISISPLGHVELGGTFLQSYGPSNYTAYACYDFDSPVLQAGTYQSVNTSSPTVFDISLSSTSNMSLEFPFTSSVSPIQAGGLIAFNSSQVVARFGVSMISSAQACSNAEDEIPTTSDGAWDWDAIMANSNNEWEGVLSRVLIDMEKENSTVVELLYSSLYRASLIPANFTGENPYWDSPFPFFDAMFCSWDVFRTVHPLLSLTSPQEWSQIVNAYVDGWRNTGYIPECRANTKPGYVQGGSDGMPILGEFAVKYAANAEELGVPMDDLYQALVDTAENTPPNWLTVGRQNTAWKTFDYIPTDWVDPSGSVGLPTREASRAYEYSLGDFAVRQAGIALNKSQADIEKYANRSMNFVNMWDPNVTSDGFSGFAQRRYQNGTFAFTDPITCSPVDPIAHSCARGDDNDSGFYESSSWEMSFFAPHSVATLVQLMGGNTTFVDRVNNYFSKGYFTAGNEPSFNVPSIYHYAGRPDLSALRIRNVVFTDFSTQIGGIPGNDDSAAMAALLTFHLLGLYPVQASTQLLIGSPFVSSYTLMNPLFNTSTTFTVSGFDNTTLVASPPSGGRVFVKSVTVNGVDTGSVCVIDFADVVGGGEVVIEVDGDADAAALRGCGPAGLPDSLETGGFPM
ncbi:glycosyl hydrolase family 92-domain-containing protein [Lentinula edodes]|uniref:glycosyl hydrolase family 92-domain-containing protein n=1 Tax=Lentinula edodes TaxID=5353 RepID=UPI001E8E8377|nr:glycosyl hydrolase family 92-domain-containing protein [Lentinula edodes]KAH7874906.1 glycosyl hydrolase family 92-domain-containing protein [Lentinula edodes]